MVPAGRLNNGTSAAIDTGAAQGKPCVAAIYELDALVRRSPRPYLSDPEIPFYFLVLFWSLAGYFFILYLVRTPFGIALQGVRDNPRRMSALGFNVTAHRVAAYAVAGLVASVGGVLLVWYNGLITPNSVGTSWLINILVIAVLGGMKHPIGPFIGAIVFVLLQTFAIDLVDRERFNLVIGGVFLAIVLFSPDGLLGLWAHLRARFTTGGAVSPTARPSGRRFWRQQPRRPQ